MAAPGPGLAAVHLESGKYSRHFASFVFPQQGFIQTLNRPGL
jgi:hypothetical protein